MQLCHNHRDLQFERTAAGELIIMAPTGGNTGRRNVKLTTIEQDYILILAVMHCSCEPGYWKSRK